MLMIKNRIRLIFSRYNTIDSDLGWPLNTIFVRTVDYFVCVLLPISGVFTTHSISLIFI